MDNFIILVLKFYLFYSFFFLYGRAIISNFLKNRNIETIDDFRVFGIEIHIFYPILGVMFLGNFLFMFNFFFPIKSNYFLIFYLFLFLNFKFPLSILNLKKFVYFSSVYIVLIISSYNIGFHYDAGLYHLNNQLWLRESNIIFGFSNIYSVFGVSSIYEYISSLLWIDKTFILLHFLNLLFIGLLYKVMIFSTLYTKNTKLKNAFYMILIFSLLDNFGFSGGRNGFISIQSLGKQDLAIGVIFLLLALFIVISIIDKNFKKNELLIISIFSLFLFQLKISAVPIFFLYLLYLYLFIRNRNYDVVIKTIFPILLFGIFWIIKSVIHTGCLVFPLSVTCFKNLDWVYIDYIRAVEDVSVVYSNSYYFNESFSNWLIRYFELSINKTIGLNFLISFLLILLLNINKLRNKLPKSINLLVILFTFISILFYLRFGPDVRYLIGFQMFLIAMIGVYSDITINLNRKITLFIIFISIIFIPRIQTYKEFNFFSTPNLELPTAEVVKLNNRYYPKDGDQCWANIECSGNKEFYFILLENEYFKKVLIKNEKNS